MKRWCARALRCAVFFALAATAAGGAGAAETLQARGAAGDVMLAAGPGGARLRFADGRALDVALPERAETSALAAAGDRWWLAGSAPDDEGGRRLLLLAGDGRRGRRLPVPGGQRGRLRQSPVLLVDGGRLAGLAWLEGDGVRGLTVAAAAVGPDGGWRRPVRVSGPGPGSQLALTGAVLGDGSWLLAWSAYDGQDDEIVWSRRSGGGWLPPARVSADDAVPDVTPALIATKSGALLAWSRFDGNDYRLRLARFAGGEWRDERWAGEAGTVFPAFAGDADRPWLSFRSAAAGAWVAEELDEMGVVLRRAEAPGGGEARPGVAATAGGLRLVRPADAAAGGEER